MAACIADNHLCRGPLGPNPSCCSGVCERMHRCVPATPTRTATPAETPTETPTVTSAP
jgi:hypothetical protein